MNRNLQDGLNFFSKVTWPRAWNALKNVSSYLESKISGRTIHRGLPIAISIEPTTSCNLRCPECPSGLRSFTRPTGMLPEKLFKHTIDELTMYSWKVDPLTGLVLPALEDKDNHLIDSLRYAVEAVRRTSSDRKIVAKPIPAVAKWSGR